MSNSNKTICRACLGFNSRMYDIRNTPLQGIFEKVTGAELTSEGRSAVCYLCSAQLQSCARFQDMVRRADWEFKRLVSMDTKWPRLSSLSSLRRTAVDCLSLPVQELTEGTVSVKIEPLDIEVKQELQEVKVEDYLSEDDFTMIPEELNMAAAAPAAPTSHQCLNQEKTIHHCRFCLKEIYSLDQLARHESSHDIETCHICNAEYPRSKRDKHTRKHTKPFECHKCHKSFSEQSTLKKHLTSHSDTKPFVCLVCSKAFSHKTYLSVHKRSHTGEKPYTCGLCAKTFTQIGHLITHRRTHSSHASHASHASSRLECDTCGASFAFRCSLIKHLSQHARARPLSCPHCDKSFARADTLAVHVRCHTGEKPFKCDVCGKAFAAKANYRKHVKTHRDDLDSE